MAINAGIVSLYMSNIKPELIQAQRKVVDKFNVSKYPFYQINCGPPERSRHSLNMDATWHMNGINVRQEFKGKIQQQFDHDVLLFLDIDALPLNAEAIDSYITQADAGLLVGNVQRSNHINNGQHLFVAPSAMAISVSTLYSIGRPSAVETSRGDVGEEYTWQMEKRFGSRCVKLYMPLRFEGKPFSPPGHPEVSQWDLKDGMPGYGLQTTFGDDVIETFWHNFQSFYPGQDAKFLAKCDALLANTETVT